MKTFFKHLPAVMLLGSVAWIASCGGGASSDGSSTTSPVPAAPAISATAVSVDPTLPSATTASIAQIVSPNGAAALGNATTLPIDVGGPIGESMVYALTSVGDLMLAATTTSATTVLSADSTALAFVRILVGSVPAGVTASSLNAAIRSAAEYPTLVGHVDSAIRAVTPPGKSAAVRTSLSTVLSQISPQVASQATASSAGRSRALDLPANQITTPLPFTIVQDTLLGLLPVGVTGTCGTNCKGNYSDGNDVAVVNNMPASWSVSTSDPVSKAALSAPQLIPANPSILKAIATATTGWSLATPYAATGNKGRSLLLTVGQSTDSQLDNAANLIVAVLDFGIERGPNTCTVNVIKPLAKGLVQIQLNISHLGSGELLAKDVFKEFFGSFFETSGNLTSILSSCTSNASLGPFLAATAKLLEENPLAAALKSAGVLAYQAAYVFQYWNAPTVTFGICVDAQGFIEDCAATFQFTPSALFATIGVEVSALTRLSAQDKGGNSVGLPAGLVYTANDGASTLQLDASSGLATSIGASPLFIPTTVSATDPVSGKVGSYAVTVVKSPVISPNPATVQVGQSVQLTLTDGAGHSVVVPPGTDWESSDKTKLNCVFEVAGGLSCGGGTSTTFTGIASGLVTVTVSNTAAGFSVSVPVQVGDVACPASLLTDLTTVANAFPFYSTPPSSLCFIPSKFVLYTNALKALPEYSIPSCVSIINAQIASQSNVPPNPVLPVCP